MRRKISLSTTVTLVLLAIALTVSMTMLLAMRHFNDQLQQVNQRQAEYEHVHNIDTIVRKYYPNLDEQLLRQGIAQGFVDGVGDPYAAYYDPNRYKTERLRLSGKAEGLGITLGHDAEGRVVVSRVQPHSSAGKGGVKVGDLVTKLDSESIEGKTLAELHTGINAAQKLVLTVHRDGKAESFSLTSDEYDLSSVESAVLSGTKIGYIRIVGFYDNTPAQFSEALTAMKEKANNDEITALVFDLRNNAGGNQAALQAVLGEVMPLGTYGQMTDSTGKVTKLTTSSSKQVNFSTATLINSGTAGEAEFFAGALQEASLTTVVGQTSVGKAKCQQYFPLDADRSAIKLTVGEYSLLKGGSWEGKGIEPQVTAELPTDQAALSGLLKPEEDAQVQAAVELLTKYDSNILPPQPETETPPIQQEGPTEEDPNPEADKGDDANKDDTAKEEGDDSKKEDDTTTDEGDDAKKEDEPTKNDGDDTKEEDTAKEE